MSHHHSFAAIFDMLHPDEQDDLLERFRLACETMMRAHGPRARHYAFADGEGLSQETLAQVYGETRVYPEGLSPFAFLVGVARSVLSHEARRPVNQRQRTSLGAPGNDTKAAALELPADADVDAEASANVSLTEFKKKVGPELAEHVDQLVEEEGSTAEEFAKRRGKRVQDINNLNRKLARRRGQWNAR